MLVVAAAVVDVVADGTDVVADKELVIGVIVVAFPLVVLGRTPVVVVTTVENDATVVDSERVGYAVVTTAVV